MNKKRKIEGFIWIVAGIILILLLVINSPDKSSNDNLFSLILMFFGKMTWFLGLSAIAYGAFVFFWEKVNVTRGKIIAFIGWFLSLSLILIRNSVLHGNPLSKTFIEAGRELLSYGFNKQSGGVLGGVVSMPFYKVISSSEMGILLIVFMIVSIFFVVKDFIEFGYE